MQYCDIQFSHSVLCLRKKWNPFYIWDNLLRYHPILPILHRNIPRERGNN